MKRVMGILLSIVLFLLPFTACSEGVETKDKANNAGTINENIVNANSEVAFDIFKKLNSEDSDTSVFISPFSISTALTMTYNGANLTTKTTIAKVLGYSNIDNIYNMLFEVLCIM